MYNHILIPVALDHASQAEPACKAAERLLAEGGQITFLHVLESIPAYVATQIPMTIHDENRRNAQQALEKVAAKSSARTDCEVVVGHAGRTILDFAESCEADCIVIASHAPGIQDYFLGSTAARVVRHAQCSVLVMR